MPTVWSGHRWDKVEIELTGSQPEVASKICKGRGLLMLRDKDSSEMAQVKRDKKKNENNQSCK